MFSIKPVSGSVERSLSRALRVAQNCPNEAFIFVFNDVHLYLDPTRDLEFHLKEYHRRYEDQTNVV